MYSVHALSSHLHNPSHNCLRQKRPCSGGTTSPPNGTGARKCCQWCCTCCGLGLRCGLARSCLPTCVRWAAGATLSGEEEGATVAHTVGQAYREARVAVTPTGQIQNLPPDLPRSSTTPVKTIPPKPASGSLGPSQEPGYYRKTLFSSYVGTDFEFIIYNDQFYIKRYVFLGAGDKFRGPRFGKPRNLPK